LDFKNSGHFMDQMTTLKKLEEMANKFILDHYPGDIFDCEERADAKASFMEGARATIKCISNLESHNEELKNVLKNASSTLSRRISSDLISGRHFDEDLSELYNEIFKILGEK
jgi:hypothetical protein